MTAPEQKEKTAAALFAGFMALALGGAGFLVAVLAVGIERAWTGGQGEAGQARQRRQSWLDDQRSWLGADHQRRADRARERQEWYASGADPAKEPAKPSLLKRLGQAVRRTVANVAVAGRDFVDGCRDGARAANEERRKPNTGHWWEPFTRTASARPEPKPQQGTDSKDEASDDSQPDTGREQADRRPQTRSGPTCPTCEFPLDVHADGTTTCPTCDWATGDSNNPQPATADIPSNAATLPVKPCPRCGKTARIVPSGWCETCTMRKPHGFCPVCKGMTRLNGDTWMHGSDWPCTHQQPLEPSHTIRCSGCGTPQPMHPSMSALGMVLEHCPACPTESSHPASRPEPNTPTEGEPMTDTETSAAAAPSAPQGESNAAVLRSMLQAIGANAGHVGEHTDALAKLQQQMEAQVRSADEFAQATGQSAQTRQALDEAQALTRSMTVGLDQFSAHAVAAEDQMGQASQGLRVAEDADDQLRSAGADGRAVAPAGAHA